MASSPIISACVTRILALSNFSPELKTRDIQAAFSEWENERGGFKIKWVDDTSLLLVFADANTAKRAYLSTILSPPPALTSPTSASAALIKPYDGPDAQTVIQAVNNRRNHASSASRASISIPNGSQAHNRQASSASNGDPYGSLGRSWKSPVNGTNPINIVGAKAANGGARLSGSPPQASIVESGTPPKFGDPAKRMVGAALGIRHPGVTSKSHGDHAVREAQKAMGGLTIAE
jgi:hypothetical protein